jgi:hypothetical protein
MEPATDVPLVTGECLLVCLIGCVEFIEIRPLYYSCLLGCDYACGILN